MPAQDDRRCGCVFFVVDRLVSRGMVIVISVFRPSPSRWSLTAGRPRNRRQVDDPRRFLPVDSGLTLRADCQQGVDHCVATMNRIPMGDTVEIHTDMAATGGDTIKIGGHVSGNQVGDVDEKEEFIKTTYDISLDSQISLFPDGFSLQWSRQWKQRRTGWWRAWIHRHSWCWKGTVDPALTICLFLFPEPSQEEENPTVARGTVCACRRQDVHRESLPACTDPILGWDRATVPWSSSSARSLKDWLSAVSIAHTISKESTGRWSDQLTDRAPTDLQTSTWCWDQRSASTWSRIWRLYLFPNHLDRQIHTLKRVKLWSQTVFRMTWCGSTWIPWDWQWGWSTGILKIQSWLTFTVSPGPSWWERQGGWWSWTFWMLPEVCNSGWATAFLSSLSWRCPSCCPGSICPLMVVEVPGRFIHKIVPKSWDLTINGCQGVTKSSSFNPMDTRKKGRERQRSVHGRLNASWKICSLAVNGQSFLVIDGYLLNPFFGGSDNRHQEW